MAELTAIQMVSCPDILANFEQLERLLAEHPVQSPRLTVLPECFACFGDGDKRLLAIAKQDSKNIFRQISRLAKKYGTWIVPGTVPVLSEGGEKFRACCWVVDEHGELQARYDKIHLFDVAVEDNTGTYCESRFTQAGNAVVKLNTPFGKLGVAVCYDLRFPGLFQAMQDIDVLALPSAFTEKTGAAHWHTLLRARSIEMQCYVIGANQGGTHTNGRQTYGNSVIYSPWGDKVTSIEKGPGIIGTALQSNLLKDIRSAMPIQKHKRFRSDFD
jgi:nitrilase